MDKGLNLLLTVLGNNFGNSRRSGLIRGQCPPRPGPSSSVGSSGATLLWAGHGVASLRASKGCWRRAAPDSFPSITPFPTSTARSRNPAESAAQGPGAPAGWGDARESQPPHGAEKRSPWLLINRVHHQKLIMHYKGLCRFFKLLRMAGFVNHYFLYCSRSADQIYLCNYFSSQLNFFFSRNLHLYYLCSVSCYPDRQIL